MIEKLLERQATALESIARSLATIARASEAHAAVAAGIDGLVKEARGEAAAVVKQAVEEAKPASRTAKAEPKAEPKQEPKQEPKPAEEKKADDKPVLSLDKVREALRNYAAIEGKDAARKIIKDVGGCDGLNDVPTEKYAAIVEACK